MKMKAVLFPLLVVLLAVAAVGGLSTSAIGGGFFSGINIFGKTKSVVLTGTNHESIILDPSKDVFVKFHAPWCSHCKTMQKEWEKLGEAMDPSEFTIAELDGGEHRKIAHKYKVKSYPTLLLFKKGSKDKPLNYRSYRTAEDMQSFLLTGEVRPVPGVKYD